jgi:CBS domain-containing protein
MFEKGLHRLPVVSRNGHALLGIVSLTDLTEAALDTKLPRLPSPMRGTAGTMVRSRNPGERVGRQALAARPAWKRR